jgi:hypothetical protein
MTNKMTNEKKSVYIKALCITSCLSSIVYMIFGIFTFYRHNIYLNEVYVISVTSMTMGTLIVQFILLLLLYHSY